MDEKLLDEIEKVCEIASPGPLEFTQDALKSDELPVVWAAPPDRQGIVRLGVHEDDEAWLMNATAWLPALVRELREARAKITEWQRTQFEEVGEFNAGYDAAMAGKSPDDEPSTIEHDAWRPGFAWGMYSKHGNAFARVEALEAACRFALDEWFDKVYSPDIFIGGPSSDPGVNEVVEVRERLRAALAAGTGAESDVG